MNLHPMEPKMNKKAIPVLGNGFGITITTSC